MALSVSTLRQGLMQTMSNPARDYVTAARQWALAYANYASTAQSPLGVASETSIRAAQEALQAALVPIFATSTTAPQTASQLASAFTAFWLAPPIVFVGTPPGAVTVVPGSVAIPGSLLAAWATNFASKAGIDQAATRLAQVLDAFTRTVVTLTPTVPSPTIGVIF